MPSSNHLIETLPGPNEVFLTLRNGVIQVMRLACSAQKPFGSATERWYISWYFGLVDGGALLPLGRHVINLVVGHRFLHA